MQILTNTDHTIEGREALYAHVNEVVERVLSHSREHITRVEVHLSDEHGNKSGQGDKRCMMEARLARHQPIIVTEHAASLHQAIDGAAHKLSRVVDSTVGRLHDKALRRDDVSALTPAEPEA